MAAPTFEELQILPQFRENIANLNLNGFVNTDLGLLQWLRARELKLDQAEAMLRKSMKWRRDNKIDSILNWHGPPIFESLCPLEICGLDKENCPVCFVPFGTWDARKVYNSGHRDDFILYVMQLFEKLRAQGQGKFLPSGQPVTQCVFIVDAKGCSMQTLACMGAINMFMDVLRNMEANYPETIKKIIAVNGSRIFTAFFNLVKPIMSQRTFGKVEIYNSNVDKWLTVLLELVRMEQLPQNLIQNRKNSESDSSPLAGDYISICVGAGQKQCVDFKVQKTKSILTWSFTTVDFDISFGLTFVKEDSRDGAVTILVPFSVVQSHMEPQEGVIMCEKKGTYKLVFDNSSSRMRAKSLKYRAELMDPEK